MTRSIALCLALGMLAGACSTTAQTAAPPSPAVAADGGTVPLDGLPETLTAGSLAPVPTVEPEPDDTAPPTTSATTQHRPGDPSIEAGTVADYVDGNRVLVIGDSIMASTARRFSGIMCDVLNDEFGWSVETHAEIGQHLEFADTVLDERLGPLGLAGFDAVVVMLGNNYRGDYDEFTQGLEALIERLSPMPIVLFTLTERHADHPAINDYIGWRPYFHANVIVVDWAQFTAAEPDRLLAGDGLHLSDEGRGRLVIFTAAALGPAPDTIGRPTCVENVL